MKNYRNPNKLLDEVIELVQLKEMYRELQQKYKEAIERISKAQDFIRNESYLNDTEIDELCEILEGLQGSFFAKSFPSRIP